MEEGGGRRDEGGVRREEGYFSCTARARWTIGISWSFNLKTITSPTLIGSS